MLPPHMIANRRCHTRRTSLFTRRSSFLISLGQFSTIALVYAISQSQFVFGEFLQSVAGYIGKLVDCQTLPNFAKLYPVVEVIGRKFRRGSNSQLRHRAFLEREGKAAY